MVIGGTDSGDHGTLPSLRGGAVGTVTLLHPAPGNKVGFGGTLVGGAGLEVSLVPVRLLNLPQKETFPLGPETNTQKTPKGLPGRDPGRERPFLSTREGEAAGLLGTGASTARARGWSRTFPGGTVTQRGEGSAALPRYPPQRPVLLRVTGSRTTCRTCGSRGPSVCVVCRVFPP